MQDLVAPDRLDLRVINALQVNPRASWTQIGAVIGTDPVTAARRWEQLNNLGLAWMTAYPNVTNRPRALAFVEIECAGHFASLAESLAEDPQCTAIDMTSGGRDLALTVVAATEASLISYLIDRLGRLEQTRAVRTHVVTRVIASGDRWRLQVLTKEQCVRLAAPAEPSSEIGTPFVGFTDAERRVIAGLTLDGRMPISELAEKSGLSPRRAGTVLRGLIASDRVTWRTELVRSASGWPVMAWMFLQVSASSVDVVSARIRALPEIRTVLNVAGPSNVIVAVQLRELFDVGRLEAAIEERLPSVRIVDRSVVLRSTKHAGVVLDDQGRGTHSVPMELLR